MIRTKPAHLVARLLWIGLAGCGLAAAEKTVGHEPAPAAAPADPAPAGEPAKAAAPAVDAVKSPSDAVEQPAPAVTPAAKGKSAEQLLAAAQAAEAKGLLTLGASLTERNDFAAAEIAYRQILGTRAFTKPEQTEALLGLAHCYRRAGAYTKAAAIYEKFLGQFPDEPRVPDVLLDLGRTLRAMGAHRLALSRFYNVINSTLKLPTEGFDHYQLLAKTAQFEIAETHFESGNFTEAGKFFARLRLLDLAPADRARAHFKSAYALQLAGDLEGSVTTMRSYLEQWPQDENVPEARYLLATTLRQLNRADEALAATLELLRTQQGTGDVRRWSYWQRRTGNQLANEFFQRGDTDHALAIYQGLVTLAPEAVWRLPLTYQIALCHERLRQLDRARADYRTIIDTVAAATAAKGDNAPIVALSPELKDLAHMAEWRLGHMDWTDQTDRKLTAFFSTTTGQRPELAPPAPTHDANASTPAAPAAVR